VALHHRELGWRRSPELLLGEDGQLEPWFLMDEGLGVAELLVIINLLNTSRSWGLGFPEEWESSHCQ
jgi:hypothetical protein